MGLCGQEVLNERLPTLRAIWESTSFQLERLQANPLCVQEEEEGLASRTQQYLKLTFDPSQTPINKELCETMNPFHNLESFPYSYLTCMLKYLTCVSASGKPCAAVVREEGSNGDREMSASLFMAGFEVKTPLHKERSKICVGVCSQ